MENPQRPVKYEKNLNESAFSKVPEFTTEVSPDNCRKKGPDKSRIEFDCTVATNEMENPWGSNCLSLSQETIEQFEDSFVSDERLPDSQQYLESLEKKLEKLKNKRTKDKELLKALSKTKQSHLERIVEADSSQILNDPDLDQPVVSSTLHRFIAPEKQANTISELYELIKYDQLGQLFEELEKEKNLDDDGGR